MSKKKSLFQKTMTNRGLVLVIGILIGASGLLLITKLIRDPSFVPTSEVSPIVKWQTFTDDIHGYSIKYPPGWSAEDITAELENKPLQFVVFMPDLSFLNGPTPENAPWVATLRVSDTDYKQEISSLKSYRVGKAVEKQVFLGGVPSTVLEGLTQGSEKIVVAVIPHSDKTLVFSFFPDLKQYSKSFSKEMQFMQSTLELH